ncbi:MULTISPECIES: GNAT family N-acetyltransferase [Flavobacterium]|jgi:GNAT superfamily N-acetyltransferase|uniref:Acetyltransferase (GNAT) domain-containing protein n=2 Tax=Flavobacterium johnsoniae TaxID=986 RepID=A0A1M5TRI6_FLAJO|nr:MULTISPECIES: GNAT family N-acetyltransferase [Flavobacterium]ABQ07043.1 GCN5-related N-acetyltransferase [Flavobacterium johnsoniae UW101]OXE98763.1 N-acetyltransferase [Flavobacterium johnsoniae UW101]WDF57760.1 GNAT family N-acetyltransferase [Flavobacterium sp. KACC 22758]WQG81121.1 GNAT family N-acetyltransferase [Flavobacterium johnsoniae UW101]SHH53216.1 Acetyltransferase (GNAT) domain-containing protein [Flavobacterium johnsoniae]
MKPIIKPVDNQYSNAIVDLVLTIQQKEFNVPITIEDQPDLFNIPNFYYADGGGFWGAFIDDQLVGTIALVKFADNAAAIRKMFVKKEFRGKEYAIAQKLLETLIAYSKENGIDDLYLGTITILEAALRFYEKNNFVRIQKEKLPEGFPLMAPDNVFCHLNLKK